MNASSPGAAPASPSAPALLKKAAAILRANAKEYGRLMALEMGKPVKDGAAEANKSALGCDYYADHAEKFLAPEIVATDARKSFVAFQPLGVILAVMPWNFPFWQVFRAAAPALMAGNAMVLKHASNVPGCALAIEKIFAEAGFPDGPVPHPDDRVEGGRRRDRASADSRRDADRLDRGGQGGRRQGRAHAEKDRARTRRQRRLCRARRRRHRAGGANLDQGPPGQFRPELHRGQALHRHRQDQGGVRGRVRQADERGEDGRSARREQRGRAAGASRSARRAASPGASQHRQGRQMLAGRRHPEQPGRVLSADGADRREAGHARL